jgi:regulator of sigma E protease
MPNVIYTLITFIIALTILISVHEWGHFIVAKACGVKVLRFSIGFGKVIFSRRSKAGTQWALSLVPLGGYVKMLDESIEPVSSDEQHRAFNRQSLLRRTLIVLAGPVFNLLLAFVIFWGVFVGGITQLRPVVGGVRSGSLAASMGLARGDQILQINQHKTGNWTQVRLALIQQFGDGQALHFQVKQPNGPLVQKSLTQKNWSEQLDQSRLLSSFGLRRYLPSMPAVVNKVIDGGPAAKAGFKVGDKITAIDDKPIKDWNEFASYIKVRPLQPVRVTVLRGQGGQRHPVVLSVTLGAVSVGGDQQIGRIGIQTKPIQWPSELLQVQRYSVGQAVMPALRKTVQLTALTFKIFGKLVTGRVSYRTMSGPVGIAVGAGQSARFGLSAYAMFLALISIGLGVINLLPIPMLDGGHLLFYLIEAIRRKPLSQATQEMAFRLGILVIVAVMVLALTNDITALIS